MRRRELVALLALPWLARVAGAATLELVMFERQGCPYCRQWDEEIAPIYPKTAEGRRAPLRRVNLAAPRPQDLGAIEGVIYTPTLVLRADGREVGRITGYPGEDFLWPMLARLLDHIRS